MALDHALAAAGQRPVQPRVQLVDQSSVGFLSRDKTGIARIDGTVKSGHCLPCTPDIACTPDSGRAARIVFFFRAAQPAADRKSVVSGKSVSVRVDLVGPRIIKKNTNTTTKTHDNSINT